MSFPPDRTTNAPRMVSAAELLNRAAERLDQGRRFATPDVDLSYRAETWTPDGRRWRITIEPIAAGEPVTR